jgi:ABC-type nitrate/sulfonate/bicarbonate transport system permease component
MTFIRSGSPLRKFAAIGLVLLVWQTLVTFDFINPFLLLPPSRLVVTFWDMLIDGSLVVHAASSLERVVVGFIVAAFVGTVLGVVLGWWPAVSEQLMPIVEAVRPIPPIAWTPLAILWFGIGNAPSYFLVFIGAVFPVFVNTFAAVRGLDRTQINAALCLGAGPRLLITDIIIPASLPVIFPKGLEVAP